MMYPIIKSEKRKAKSGKQAGVTLLLALLVLSAVMAIAFSLAAILLAEVRVSGDLLRTEPAIYGANAVTEEALFAVRRGYPRCFIQPCTNQFYYSTQLGEVKMNNPQPTENLFNDPILQDQVLATSDSITNTKNRYALYDPSDINLPGNFVQLKVTYKDTGQGGQIHVYVCEFKAPKDFLSTDPPIDCNTPHDVNGYMIYNDMGPFTQDQGLFQGETTATMTLDPTKQQELIIYSSGAAADRYVQIEAFGPDGPDADSNPDPKGLPFFGETVVDINAEHGGVTRSLRVTIPNTASGGSVLTDTVWVEDSLPGGAIPGSDGGDSWNWVSASPLPYSGSLASQSNLTAGEHQHYFDGATSKLLPNTGDKMIAYVYLDPTNPPTEIMLQWNSDSLGWNHRAYWGANNIAWGTDGTQSRRFMGALPATGTWVRLEVPASQVGLESQSVNGMAFTLYDGKATWDYGGKSP